jgi:hypothetical protein
MFELLLGSSRHVSVKRHGNWSSTPIQSRVHPHVHKLIPAVSWIWGPNEKMLIEVAQPAVHTHTHTIYIHIYLSIYLSRNTYVYTHKEIYIYIYIYIYNYIYTYGSTIWFPVESQSRNVTKRDKTWHSTNQTAPSLFFSSFQRKNPNVTKRDQTWHC